MHSLGPQPALYLEMPLEHGIYALHFPLLKQDTVREGVHGVAKPTLHHPDSNACDSAWVKPPLMRKTAPADQFIGFRDI